MTAYIRYLAPDANTTQPFRAWGSQISADLTEFGLVKTNDTGQINWATVNAPAANSFAGYEIRAFSDSLQSTAPCVFKIEYGANSQTVSEPAIALTVGTSSNGSGTIGGSLVSSRQILSGSASASATAMPCVLSGAPNRLAIANFINTTNYPYFFSLERTKNLLGNDTGQGVLLSFLGNAVKITQYLPFAGAALPPSGDWGTFMPTNGATGAIGIDMQLYPNHLFNFGQILFPGFCQLATFANDFPSYGTAIAVLYEINKLYYFLPNIAPLNVCSRGAIANTSLAVLFE